MCHRHSAKNKKHSAKALPSVTLSQTVHGNYSVGKQLFAECFFIAHSAKKSGLLSVFQNTLGKGLLSAECFLGITLGKPIFQRKKLIFFSAYCYCLPSVFGNYTRQTYFSKKNNNFFLSIFQFNSCHTERLD